MSMITLISLNLSLKWKATSNTVQVLKSSKITPHRCLTSVAAVAVFTLACVLCQSINAETFVGAGLILTVVLGS